MLIVIFAITGMLLLLPDLALAWGPATHIYLASHILTLDATIPSATLALLRTYQVDFFFGNISADILLGKKYVDWRLHCHNWEVGKTVKNAARTDAEKAFAYGYLCHLAADTVAHNHFVPRQLFAYPSISDIGHAFWEIRADSLVDRQYWEMAKYVNEQDHSANERLLEEHLTPSIFTFKTNKRIFDHMMLMTNLRQWQNFVEMANQYSRYQLTNQELEHYHALSVERITRFLVDENDPEVLSWDPTGGERLKFVKKKRRTIARHLRRANMPRTEFQRIADQYYVHG